MALGVLLLLGVLVAVRVQGLAADGLLLVGSEYVALLPAVRAVIYGFGSTAAAAAAAS